MYFYALINLETKIIENFIVYEVPADLESEPYLIPVDEIEETWVRRKKYDAATQTFVDVTLDEAVTSNSLEFTHIDANGTKHWLDEYVNDLAEDVANAGNVDTSAFAAANHTHTPASIGAAASSHNHSAADITSGTLAVGRGGTGSTAATKSVTINRGADAGTGSSAFGYTCQYIPYLNMCFVRIYVQPKSTWSADTEYEVGTIGSSTYYPASMMALSNYAQKEVCAYVNTEGKIVVRPYESVGTSYGIRLAGFWFC